MKLIDRWTTQHGTWDVNPANKYGIDQAHRDKYLAGRDIPGAGGDHHIFVYAPSTSHVFFRTENSITYGGESKPDSQWVNFPIFNGAGYYPDRGEVGPWQVWVDKEKVADGIGLPEHEHVSTFLVVDGKPVTDTPPPPTLTVQQALAQVRHDLDILESLLGGSNG